MIKCVAIDDEPIAIAILQEYCRRYGDIELECFTSPVTGMEYIRKSGADVVFLDIEMKSHNGVELARELPDNIALIFTTAYAQYAIDGYDVDAVDFLHKPIFYARFERAVEKAKKWIGYNSDRPDDFITLKVEHKNVIINLADIILVEAMDNYVKVFRRGLPMVLSQITMKEMETLLPEARFRRIHRSFIISVSGIEKISNRKVYMLGIDRPVPVGRKYLEEFNSFYNNLKANRV